MTSMDNNSQTRERKEHLLNFVGYVLTSTKGLYREPHSYGPIRMIDSLEKSLILLKELGLNDESVDKILVSIRENRWKAMSDPEGFANAIDDSIRELVQITVGEK
ncbi:DUF6092 family protein [Alkalihalobacillus sp. TS-13]|uniref:DUF6092 family protein n=1 Tax=Alkalihalobacillus sp. TS-13 TaxID=2842455 RepID=UPI001C86BF47|nr:DUF6092 family protein [Alkalihalobacillus sp. TS-13]